MEEVDLVEIVTAVVAEQLNKFLLELGPELLVYHWFLELEKENILFIDWRLDVSYKFLKLWSDSWEVGKGIRKVEFLFLEKYLHLVSTTDYPDTIQIRQSFFQDKSEIIYYNDQSKIAVNVQKNPGFLVYKNDGAWSKLNVSKKFGNPYTTCQVSIVCKFMNLRQCKDVHFHSDCNKLLIRMWD